MDSTEDGLEILQEYEVGLSFFSSFEGTCIAHYWTLYLLEITVLKVCQTPVFLVVRERAFLLGEQSGLFRTEQQGLTATTQTALFYLSV